MQTRKQERRQSEEGEVGKKIGKRTWAIAGSRIPLAQSGPEPAFTSHDSLWMLNITDEDLDVEVMIYFADREPIGPFALELDARRVRDVRINDLIDPRPVPLEKDYGILVEASGPIVVSFTQMDTGQAANARTRSSGYFDDH